LSRSIFSFLESDPEHLRNFVPLSKRVLVLIDVPEQDSPKGLIYVPTQFQKESPSGLVVARASDTMEYIPMYARVLVDSSRGTQIHDDTKHGRRFVCYDEDDIIAVFIPEEE
jgi:co-chaperonin GroES (HSP10)